MFHRAALFNSDRDCDGGESDSDGDSDGGDRVVIVTVMVMAKQRTLSKLRSFVALSGVVTVMVGVTVMVTVFQYFDPSCVALLGVCAPRIPRTPRERHLLAGTAQRVDRRQMQVHRPAMMAVMKWWLE